MEFEFLKGPYPAKDPPIQAMVAGENAGALPALAPARVEVGGGGDGLLRMAKSFVNGRRTAYRSYCGGAGLSGRIGCRDVGDGGAMARSNSA